MRWDGTYFESEHFQNGMNSAAEEYRPVLRSADNQFGLYVVFSHLRSLNFLTLGLWIEPFMHIAQTHLNFRSMENGKRQRHLENTKSDSIYRLVTFETFDQSDEETWTGQQKDKDI